MVKSLNKKLALEYPEILELNDLLQLAEMTWVRYGLSAKDLSRTDAYILNLLRILIDV
jgi:hypothetical protein